MPEPVEDADTEAADLEDLKSLDSDIHGFDSLDWSSPRAIRQHMRSKHWSYDNETHSWVSPIYPAAPPEEETFETLLQRYNEYRAEFLKSPSWRSLKRIVSRFRTTGMKNAVCIALGSVSAVGQRTGTLEDRVGAMGQLVGFLAVVREMERGISGSRTRSSSNSADATDGSRRRIKGKMPMLAQEPRFNSLDKQLLRHLGIRVVSDPGIWNKITRKSMVFMPGAEARHFLKVSRRKPMMWWPVDRSYLGYVKEIFPEAPTDEYKQTHHYLRFQDMRYSAFTLTLAPDTDTDDENTVFGADAAIYLRKG